jgi:GGDEF domain-containing protein
LVAIALADFTMDIISAGYPTRIAYGLGVANALEPLLAATLLRRWLGHRLDLSRLRDLGLFYLAAGVCGPMLSAIVGSPWHSLQGGGPVWSFGARWYVGDALGVIVVAPVILSVAGASFRPMLTFARSSVFAGTLAVIAVALPWRFSAAIGLPCLVIPALSVTGIVLGTRAAAMAVFLAGAVVETLTAIGSGPFAGTGDFTGLLSAQMYMVAGSASGLTAAALMAGLMSREQMALHDSLTGLANRRLLIDRFSVACSQLARSPGVVGLMFIDLDDFKAFNDAYGHHVGERVGEVVTEPIGDGGQTVRLGASVGYSITERHDESHETLLARADHAMYTAKRARSVA